MVSKKQQDLKTLSTSEQTMLVKKWKSLLAAADASERTLNLHTMMTEVARLKSTHSSERVDVALTQIFPGSSTRTRMQRLHEIPLNRLKNAIDKFRDSKASTPGDIRSISVLSITHLEALGRCGDKATRLELLAECGSKGWTVAQLRAAVVSKRDSKKIQPLALAKQIRAHTGHLNRLLSKVKRGSLQPAVLTVKVRDQQNAIEELKAADSDLRKLARHIEATSVILKNARIELANR
jgi:hypothetical protein